MKPPLLDYFDSVIVLAAKGEQFGLLIADQQEATGIELNLEDAEDLIRRLADLLFINEPAKANEAREERAERTKRMDEKTRTPILSSEEIRRLMYNFLDTRGDAGLHEDEMLALLKEFGRMKMDSDLLQLALAGLVKINWSPEGVMVSKEDDKTLYKQMKKMDFVEKPFTEKPNA